LRAQRWFPRFIGQDEHPVGVLVEAAVQAQAFPLAVRAAQRQVDGSMLWWSRIAATVAAALSDFISSPKVFALNSWRP